MTTTNTRIDLTPIDRIIEQVGREPDAVIPILHAVQREYRYLPQEALQRVCELTEITPASITGIAEFQASERITDRFWWETRVKKLASVNPMIRQVSNVTNKTLARVELRFWTWSFIRLRFLGYCWRMKTFYFVRRRGLSRGLA